VSDTRLRALERQAEEGDEVAAELLARARCRLGEHRYANPWVQNLVIWNAHRLCPCGASESQPIPLLAMPVMGYGQESGDDFQSQVLAQLSLEVLNRYGAASQTERTRTNGLLSLSGTLVRCRCVWGEGPAFRQEIELEMIEYGCERAMSGREIREAALGSPEEVMAHLGFPGDPAQTFYDAERDRHIVRRVTRAYVGQCERCKLVVWSVPEWRERPQRLFHSTPHSAPSSIHEEYERAVRYHRDQGIRSVDAHRFARTAAERIWQQDLP